MVLVSVIVVFVSMSLVYSRSVRESRANSLLSDCHPGHRLADVWAFPDHGVLAEGLSQGVGVVHVGGPAASPLVESVAEGLGLNCVVEHLVDSVSTTIEPHATHVQGQCATASPGYDSGVSRFRAVLRKRPEGGPARLPLPRRPEGAPAPYARGHFFDRPLAYRAQISKLRLIVYTSSSISSKVL